MFEGNCALVIVVWPVFCFLWSIHFLFVGCFCQFGSECVQQIESRTEISPLDWDPNDLGKLHRLVKIICTDLQLLKICWRFNFHGLGHVSEGGFGFWHFFCWSILNRKWWSDQQFWGTRITGDSHVTNAILAGSYDGHIQSYEGAAHKTARCWDLNFLAKALSLPAGFQPMLQSYSFQPQIFVVLLQSICEMWEVYLFFVHFLQFGSFVQWFGIRWFSNSQRLWATS